MKLLVSIITRAIENLRNKLHKIYNYNPIIFQYAQGCDNDSYEITEKMRFKVDIKNISIHLRYIFFFLDKGSRKKVHIKEFLIIKKYA